MWSWSHSSRLAVNLGCSARAGNSVNLHDKATRDIVPISQMVPGSPAAWWQSRHPT